MSWKNGRYISGTRGVVFRLEQMKKQKGKRKAMESALLTIAKFIFLVWLLVVLIF
jgi:hypothetical protein